MRFRADWTFWIKGAQALLLAVAVCFSLGASSGSGTRINRLSHSLMCTCGCAQLLGECDHYGCPDRDKELAELTTGINAGKSDQQILDAFVAEYGAVVLAAPPKHGFDLVAWIAPLAVFLAALLGTILLIRRWGTSNGKLAPAGQVPNTPEMDAIKEKIRRETGSDGGY
ncbi:MAG: cytochrome c-type biogenesis protein CcmH [Terracidiphilus sp.]